MTKKNFKNCIKEHRKEIMFIGTTLIGSIVLGGLFKKKHDKTIRLAEIERIKKFDFNIGNVTDLWDEDNCDNIIANSIKLSDMGEFGKQFIALDNVDLNTEVQCLLAIPNKRA